MVLLTEIGHNRGSQTEVIVNLALKLLHLKIFKTQK